MNAVKAALNSFNNNSFWINKESEEANKSQINIVKVALISSNNNSFWIKEKSKRANGI